MLACRRRSPVPCMFPQVRGALATGYPRTVRRLRGVRRRATKRFLLVLTLSPLLSFDSKRERTAERGTRGTRSTRDDTARVTGLAVRFRHLFVVPPSLPASRRVGQSGDATASQSAYIFDIFTSTRMDFSQSDAGIEEGAAGQPINCEGQSV